jgi:hypothetical protein
MKIEVPDLTGAECGDIAVTAAEGGIGYWCVIDRYDWRRWTESDDSMECVDVPDDFVFYNVSPLSDDESGYAKTLIAITPRLIRRGFEACATADLNKGGWAVQGLFDCPREDWTGEIDSDIADNIIQFGVWGRLIYG